MNDITALSVHQLISALQSGSVSAVEAAEAYLARIEATEPAVGAYLTVCGDAALAQAEEIDRLRRSGAPLPPLSGVPMALKDNLCTQGIRTTCASKMLQNFIPPYSAAVAERLQAQGAVLLGKLNMDEFAMGSGTETSFFHPTRNPVDPSRVPGGSSGGSAAAVAAQEAAFTLGSDTGGSVRQPAACCGVVGMKPTYGAVSRYGLIAFASSLDQIGPLTRNVADSALILNAIAGHDPRDATSLRASVPDCTAELQAGVKGLRFALPREFFANEVHPEIRDAVRSAARLFAAQGARIEEISFSSFHSALPAYLLISSAEASSNLARYDGVRYGYRSPNGETPEELYRNTRSEGFGAEVKRRILLGTFVLSAGYRDAYYESALRTRRAICRQFGEVFRQYHAILAPVAPETARRLGEKGAGYQSDMCTVPASLAGLPALSLPCGQDTDGLPIGLQIIGPALSEPLLYRIGNCLEQLLTKRRCVHESRGI